MLEVHTQKLGAVTVLRLTGRIGIGETGDLVDAVLSTSYATETVALDLAHVKGIDASGLGLLLKLREQTQSRGIAFKFMNVPRLVQQVLKITCLDKVFEVVTEADVLSLALRVNSEVSIDTLVQ